VVQRALIAAADSPGYPLTIGLPETRQACVDWLARRFGVTGLDINAVLPVIGSKELIASLPTHLGLGPGDLLVQPELAYPTYEVSAALVGARVIATDSLTALGPEVPKILWINSPSNPTGRVLPVEHLRKVVEWCRERGVLLVSDECYIEWPGSPECVRSRCCILMCAATRSKASWRCTLSRSGPTWLVTDARSLLATRQ
jgi:aspartate/methionine/tyrosine aminotransferase